MRLSDSSYVALVRDLPRPSPEQVEAFVRHVADAENWLKTPPLAGGAGIAAFLDPAAGMRVNRRGANGRNEYELERLDPGAELLHGSELPTEIYRRAFGFLNYHTDLGAGTAEFEGELMRRARLPGPGIVHAGRFVPLPEALLTHACHPGALLHGTFRGGHDEGSARRFRFAVERLPRLEGAPRPHPLLERIEVWTARCRAEDEVAFGGWLATTHGENPATLDEPSRWRRYVEWRDEDACTAMHRAQDAAFAQSGIPDEVVRLHAAALEEVRRTTIAALRWIEALS